MTIGQWIRNAVAAIATMLALATLSPAYALDGKAAAAAASGDGDQRVAALRALALEGDPAAIAYLSDLLAGSIKVTADGRAFWLKPEGAIEFPSGKPSNVPADADDVVNNNRMRREIGAAIAALRLVSPDRKERLEAVRALQTEPDAAILPLIQKAEAQEQDSTIKSLLSLTRAQIELESAEAEARISAIKSLESSPTPATRSLLMQRLKKDGEQWVESDPKVRSAAEVALRKIESDLIWGERLGVVFTGVSLGSILLLAALGLAITYGLMGVINMAHGELIMIGAYATFVVQGVFQRYLPGMFDVYLLAAIPTAFLVSAVVGMVLERLVIRHLYGRPLETLLATWGISLILIQSVRSLFGAQNVQVENPSWMSGGVAVMSNLTLPYNRIFIIGFAVLVLVGMALMLAKTRLGLFVRGVTQNRNMAACVGVPTARVDALAFGLGSGIAGLAGCALTQVGNVGPDLGQSYIIDSFMVVVLGGVGQLIGTVYAALGLGVLNKFLEGWTGAVIAKIIVLVMIIIFIQKRPSGLFAQKGRSTEA